MYTWLPRNSFADNQSAHALKILCLDTDRACIDEVNESCNRGRGAARSARARDGMREVKRKIYYLCVGECVCAEAE